LSGLEKRTREMRFATSTNVREYEAVIRLVGLVEKLIERK